MAWFAILGAVFDWLALRTPLPMSREEWKRRLIDTPFAVMGALCKSDGRVTTA